MGPYRQSTRMGALKLGVAACGGTIVIVSGLLLGAAGADTSSVQDGNDTYGRLDIAQVRHGHRSIDGNPRFVHTIRTYGRWNAGLLDARPGRGFAIWLDRDANESADLVAEIAYRRGRLHGRLLAYKYSGDVISSKPIAHLRVRRGNRRSASIFIPVRFFDGVDSYSWFATSYFTGGGCGRQGCADDAPEDWKKHSG